MDWSKQEVTLIVADYFSMLELELTHTPYNKTTHRKRLAGFLKRSDGSIEFKHQNISAVLSEMGLPFIKGYKPRYNYQQLLADEVSSYLASNKASLEEKFILFSEEVPSTNVEQLNFESILDDEPEPAEVKESIPTFRPIKVNYLEKEQNNRVLGATGEQLVMEYEKWRLIRANKQKLAEQVEWVSKEKGDGMGFDILSKNENGTDRYIEVKSTKLAKETPIYVSANELYFASIKGKEFYLYRVFGLGKKTGLFIKQGQYENYCILKPQSFKGYF